MNAKFSSSCAIIALRHSYDYMYIHRLATTSYGVYYVCHFHHRELFIPFYLGTNKRTYLDISHIEFVCILQIQINVLQNSRATDEYFIINRSFFAATQKKKKRFTKKNRTWHFSANNFIWTNHLYRHIQPSVHLSFDGNDKWWLMTSVDSFSVECRCDLLKKRI